LIAQPIKPSLYVSLIKIY